MLWLSAGLVAAFALFPSFVAEPFSGGSNATDPPPMAGEWIADVLFEDSTSVHLVVDLGLAGSRLTGEFDVLDWGVENYPVEVRRILFR